MGVRGLRLRGFGAYALGLSSLGFRGFGSGLGRGGWCLFGDLCTVCIVLFVGPFYGCTVLSTQLLYWVHRAVETGLHGGFAK